MSEVHHGDNSSTAATGPATIGALRQPGSTDHKQYAVHFSILQLSFKYDSSLLIFSNFDCSIRVFHYFMSEYLFKVIVVLEFI